MVYPHNGIGLSSKKEWSTDIHNNRDESYIHHVESKKLVQECKQHDYIYMKL